MTTDSTGKELKDNNPIYGCEGCNTTGGRSCCPIHGLKTNYSLKNCICCEDEEDTEIARIISKANYGAILN